MCTCVCACACVRVSVCPSRHPPPPGTSVVMRPPVVASKSVYGVLIITDFSVILYSVLRTPCSIREGEGRKSWQHRRGPGALGPRRPRNDSVLHGVCTRTHSYSVIRRETNPCLPRHVCAVSAPKPPLWCCATNGLGPRGSPHVNEAESAMLIRTTTMQTWHSGRKPIWPTCRLIPIWTSSTNRQLPTPRRRAPHRTSDARRSSRVL